MNPLRTGIAQKIAPQGTAGRLVCAAAVALLALLSLCFVSSDVAAQGFVRKHDGGIVQGGMLQVEISVGESVEVLVGPRKDLIIGHDPGLAAASMIGSVLGNATVRRNHERELPRLARIDTLYRNVPVEAQFIDALQAHLEAVEFLNADDIRLAESSVSNPDTSIDAGILRLNAIWAVPTFYDAFRAYLHAQVWPEPSKDGDGPLYEQVFIYNLQAPGRLFRSRPMERNMDYWLSKDDDYFRRHISDAVQSLAAMLAYDISRSVRLGMRRGPKQHAFTDPWVGMTYGVVEQSREDRVWLRLRNGVLVDTAEPD